MDTSETSCQFRFVLDPSVDASSLSVVVDFDGDKYARVPHALTSEASIEAAWQAALSRNPRIFNGRKFRLAGMDTSGGEVRLRLGLTDYRDYLGTNRSATVARLAADGSRDHDFDGAHLSNALGCETVLVTADTKVLLLRRSGAVATHAGEWNGPSGHGEPDACDLQDAASVRAQVLTESILAEIIEETGVPRAHLSDPVFLGCMVETKSLKPDLLFVTRAAVNSSDIATGFEKAAEKWESDDLTFLALDELRNRSLPLTAVTRAALDLVLRYPDRLHRPSR